MPNEENRYALAIHASQAAMWDWDIPSGRIEFAPRYREMLGGYTPAEFPDSLEAFFYHVHPDDRAAVQRAIDEHIAARRHQPTKVEFRLRHKSGAWRWVKTSAQAVWDAHGQAIRMVGSTHDIHEQREAERRLRQQAALLRQAGRVARVGGWCLELPEQRVIWSDEIHYLLEFPLGQPPSLADGLALYPTPWREQITAAVQTCGESGQAFDLEMEIDTATGRRLWVRVCGEAERHADGTIRRIHGALQDITRQKTTEESLVESRRRFRQMADTLPFILWTAEADGTVNYSNLEFTRYTGVSQSEPPAERWQPCLHPDDRERCLTTWADCVQAQTILDIEYRLKRAADGLYRWFRVQAKPMRDATGRVTAWYGFAIDIHDTKQLTQEATLLARRLTTTLESITEGFYTLDDAWCFTYLNATAERLLQRPRASLLGREIWTEFPNVVGGPLEQAYRQAKTTGAGSRFTYHYEALDLWLEIHLYPSEEGLAVYFLDITARREAEARLQEQAALLDKATDAILVRDLEHRVLYWNKSAEKLYGRPAAEVLGQPVRELCFSDPAPFDEAMRALLRDAEWQGVFHQPHRDGRTLIVQSRWTLVRDTAGAPKSVLVINTDITERYNLEQQLLRSQRMESIGTLAGGIAHDLNNMLAPIVMGVGLLRQITPHEEFAPILQTIESSAKRGADLVKQVLSFARGVDGQRAPLRLHAIVGEVETIILNTFPRNIRCLTRVPEDLPRILGDHTQLHQVLINLCVNARDAMPRGGEITLHAAAVSLDAQYAAMSPEARPGDYVMLAVTDTGEGIPREIIERVFDPFFTTKAVGQGTGLGLSTALGIVRSHGGFLTVYSDPGQGTTFKIYLPVQPGEAIDPPPRSPALLSPPFGQGQLILVVDDDAGVRQVTQRTLEAGQYRVLTATDGVQAIALYADDPRAVDLVLTDMMMPGMDGVALIAAIRRLRPDQRIIAASGLDTPEQSAKARRFGVAHFLTKPFTAEILLRTVHEALTTNGSRSPWPRI